MQPGGGLNLLSLQAAVANMANTLNAATAKMQSVVTGNLPLAKSAEPPGALAGVSAAFNIAAAGFVVNKVKSVVSDAMNALVDGMSEGFHRMKAIVLDTVAAFRPFEIEMFNRAVQDLKAVFGIMFLPIVQQVTAGLRELANYFYSLPPAFTGIVAGIAKWTLILGGLAVVVGTLLAVGGAMVTILTPVAMAFGMLVSVLTPLLVVMAPLVILLAPFVAGFMILAGAFAALGAALIGFNWSSVVKGFGKLFDQLMSVVDAAWQSIKPVWDQLAAAFGDLGKALGELFDAVKPLLGAGLLAVVVVVKTVLTVIIEGVKWFVNQLTSLAYGMAGVMKSLGLPGFNIPGSKEKSAAGLGLHGGSVTDPIAAFKSMQEDILKFSGNEGEPKDQTPENVAEIARIMKLVEDMLKSGGSAIADEVIDTASKTGPGAAIGLGMRMGRGVMDNIQRLF